MNKRYKFKFNIHIIGLSVVIFEVVIAFMDMRFSKKNPLDFIFIICILTTLIGVIVNLFTYYSIGENGIRLKSIIRCIDIQWKEIRIIEQRPAGRLVRLSIGVFAEDKKISVTPWTQNYKELLQLIINECEKNKGIRIDPMIYKIIENQ